MAQRRPNNELTMVDNPTEVDNELDRVTNA